MTAATRREPGTGGKGFREYSKTIKGEVFSLGFKNINCHNEDLLYSTGNYTQYFVVNYKGKILKKNTHTHMSEPLCCTLETTPTLNKSTTLQ